MKLKKYQPGGGGGCQTAKRMIYKLKKRARSHLNNVGIGWGRGVEDSRGGVDFPQTFSDSRTTCKG